MRLVAVEALAAYPDEAISAPLRQAYEQRLRKRMIELMAHLGDEAAVPELTWRLRLQNPLSRLTRIVHFEGKEQQQLAD